MKLESAVIYSFKISLRRTIYINSTPVNERQGYILRLSDEHGHVGYGEIAPLPGLHRESPETALEELTKAIDIVWKKPIESEKDLIESILNDTFLYFPVVPTVKFGLDMALLNLMAKRLKLLPSNLFASEPLQNINLNALFVPQKSKPLLELAGDLYEEGYRTFKIKVGIKSQDEDIKIVRELCHRFVGNVELILDPNRHWSLTEAVQFGKAIKDIPILYIEEPVKQPDQIETFHLATGLNVALDETLRESDLSNLSPTPGVSAYIIKPDVMGLARTIETIRIAKEHNVTSVISSSFNSGVGLAFLAQIAAACCEHSHAGLDTWRLLGKDILKHPIRSKNGKLDVSLCFRNGQLPANDLLKTVYKYP